MENVSQNIEKLALALARMQGSMGAIPKTKTAKIASKSGSSYTYQYADLADIQEATKKPLATNELSITQIFVKTEKGTIIQTLLIHSSGQWIKSELELKNHERVQELGSEITYLRRYAISSILGIVTDDDDDGKLANEAKAKKEAAAAEPEEPILPYQCEELENILGEDEDLKNKLMVYYGRKTTRTVENVSDFYKNDFVWIKELLETQKNRKKNAKA